MTFGLPIATTLLWQAAAILGGLVVVAYILKMRRRRFEVPFSTLWQRVLREKETTTLWKHLRRILSMLLVLAMLGLLLLAALDPKLGQADDDARSVVIIVDASASMKTRDAGPKGDEARIDAARRSARDLLAAMGGGDTAMVMRMDGQTTPLSRFDDDMPMLRKVVDEIQASDTPADLRRALSAAADALRDKQNPMIVLIGDGAYPEEVLGSVVWEPAPAAGDGEADAGFRDKRLAAIDLSGVDVRYLPIGQTSANVGIVAFNVRRYLTNKMAYEVFIEVQNFGDEPASRKLVLYNGGLPVDVKTLTLAPGERLRQIYPEISGGDDHRLRASIEPIDADGETVANSDAFPLDDRAYALLPRRKKQHVLLVTADNLYLEGAMLVYDNIQVDKLLPEDYEQAVGAAGFPDYDAVVFDDYTPEALPAEDVHLLYFNPEPEGSPFPITRSLEYPRITETADHHPVMRWLVFSDVNFDKSSVFRVDRDQGEVVLAQSVREPIMAAKRVGPRKVVAGGFSLRGTDLTLRVAFPLLLVNILDWFAGDDSDLITTYQTGHRFRVPMDGTYQASEVAVKTPVGTTVRAPLVDGQATFYGHSIGVHTLTAANDGQVLATIELAANLANPTESEIAPSGELILGGQTLTAPEGFELTHQRSIWMYLALLVLLLLAVEWITYNRRITV